MIANDTNGSFLNTYNADIVIGNWTQDNKYFEGYLDNLRIYNKALSATEISNLYNYHSLVTAIPIDDNTNLIAHFKFDGDLTNSVVGSSIGTLVETGTAAQFINTAGNFKFGS